MADRDEPARGEMVLPLVIAFAALLASQLVRGAWLPSVREIAARVHGEMLAAALGAAAAVLAFAAGLELHRRGRARLASGGIAVAALGLLVGEVVGMIAFACAMGVDSGPDRDVLRSVAAHAASLRAAAMIALACALAIAAWSGRSARWLGVALIPAVVVGMPLPAVAGALGRAFGASAALHALLAAAPALLGLALAVSSRPPAARVVEPAQRRAALGRVAGVLVALVAVAGAGVLLAAAVFVRRTTDPTGLTVVVALGTLVALGAVVRALLAIPVAGAPRALLALAAAVLVTYLGLSLVHLIEVLRIVFAGETYGTLGPEGRAAHPDALPIAVPAVLGVGWVLVGLALYALASTLDRSRDRALAARVGRTALIVAGCQAAIVGLLAYFDGAVAVSHNDTLTVSTVHSVVAAASLLQLARIARELAAADA
jgi:hypothetical protein